MPAPLPPEMEVANLEHELTVLRDRYENLLVERERQKRIVKYGGSLVLAVTCALVIHSVSQSKDPFPVLFLLAGLVVVIGLIHWLTKDWFSGETSAGFRFYYKGHPFRTDEEFLNHAIAIREQRLRELKATL
jgi:hypothetical protein